MPNYATARFIFGLMTILGWTLALAAIALGAFALNTGPNWPFFVGAFAACFSGLVTVATAQIGFAQIAVARNTREMVELLKRDKETSASFRPTGAPMTERVEPTLNKPL